MKKFLILSMLILFSNSAYAGSCPMMVKNYGHHRLLNIEIEPFNLKDPCNVIDDHDRKLNIYKI